MPILKLVSEITEIILSRKKLLKFQSGDLCMPIGCAVHHLPYTVQPGVSVYICRFGLWNIVKVRMIHGKLE